MITTKPEPAKTEIKSSLTAFTVAMGFSRSIFTGYEHLFSRREALLTNHLLNVSRASFQGMNRILAEVVSLLPYSIQQTVFDRLIFPGYDHIIMLRKLMIKQTIERAIQDSVKQIVFLGGGYDVRSIMTAIENPDVQVFELDRGPTRENKMAGLKSIPKGIGFDNLYLKNMKYINCDLSKDNLQTVLTTHGFNLEARTLVIAEGVTVYLTEEANRQLLKTVNIILKNNGEFLLSYTTLAPYYSALQKSRQKSSEEMYQFCLSPNSVIDFTRNFGFDVIERFPAMDSLDLIGDKYASYYKNHQEAFRENYYLLRKHASKPGKKIEDVPVIKLNIPHKTI